MVLPEVRHPRMCRCVRGIQRTLRAFRTMSCAKTAARPCFGVCRVQGVRITRPERRPQAGADLTGLTRGQSGSGACPEPVSRRDCHGRIAAVPMRHRPRSVVRNDAGVGAAAVQRGESGSCAAAIQRGQGGGRAAAVQSLALLTSGRLLLTWWHGEGESTQSAARAQGRVQDRRRSASDAAPAPNRRDRQGE